MSLTLPILNMKNEVDASKIDIRFYDGKLYISKVEDDGTILEGAELLVERLPPEAIYGSNFTGETVAEALIVNLNLNINIENLNLEDKQELLDKLLELIQNASSANAEDTRAAISEIKTNIQNAAGNP